jgi:hypothetical protein
MITLPLDGSGALFRQFDVRGLPVFLVIDSAGCIIERVEGATDPLKERLAGKGMLTQ